MSGSIGDEAALARLRRALVLLARLGVAISYVQAAEALGFRPPGVIRKVTDLLERSMEEDAATGRPFGASLVVSPRRNWMPAPGFFETAARLGRYAGPPTGPEAMAWAEAERARATAALAAPAPGAQPVRRLPESAPPCPPRRSDGRF